MNSETEQNVPSLPETETKPEPPAKKRPFFWRPGFALAALVIVFLAVGTWNLGSTKLPQSDYTPVLDPEQVVLDLGSTVHVDQVFLLVQDYHQVNVDISAGSPGNWVFAGNISQYGSYREWKEVDPGRDARYVQLNFKGASGVFGEVLVFSNTKKVAIKSATGPPGGGNAAALIDEQGDISNPASDMSGSYFDEIYFARTAEETISIQEPFEWSHPPLGKEMIAFGMMAFGYTPFGWRISGVFFGAVAIIITFLVARKLFGNSRAALIAAFLVTFDFMHFAMARIGTGETFLYLFIAIMVYFFYRYLKSERPDPRNLFLAVVFFGLSFSVKWVAINVFVGLVLLMLVLKWPYIGRICAFLFVIGGIVLGTVFGRIVGGICLAFIGAFLYYAATLSYRKAMIQENKGLYRKEVIWFFAGLVVAAVIYLLCYIPYFLVPAHHDHGLIAGLRDWWNLQFSMFYYHADLRAGHPFGSKWWAWPIMLRPLWMYSGSFAGKTSQIVSFGNPALWRPAIPMMLMTLWAAIGSPWFWWMKVSGKAGSLWLSLKQVDKTALLIVVPFLTQWLLFIPIPRVTFIYHFYPSVLFMALAVAYWMNKLWDKGRWKWFVVGYLVLNVATFAFFYPVISGYPMGQGYWDSLKWLLQWVL